MVSGDKHIDDQSAVLSFDRLRTNGNRTGQGNNGRGPGTLRLRGTLLTPPELPATLVPFVLSLSKDEAAHPGSNSDVQGERTLLI